MPFPVPAGDRQHADQRCAAHRLLLGASIRRIEAAAIAGLPPGTLMARAAEAVAEATAALARSLAPRRPILALVGPGNNGGDALLAALRLREFGFAVRALALAPREEPPGDAGAAWRSARAVGFPIEAISSLHAIADAPLGATTPSSASARPATSASGAPIVIDGLFGIGLSRPLDGETASICAAIERAGWPVVAVDVPSGLDADTGAPVGGPGARAIRARATVTMIADKPGLHTGAAVDHVGVVSVATLGVDDRLRASVLAGTARADVGSLYGEHDAAANALPARARDSNKGDHGSVSCFGGAAGMRGAILLAARAAQSMGAGKVFVGTPEGDLFDPGQPQLMTADAEVDFGRYSSVAIGCGLGASPEASAAVARAIAEARALVVDADALNAVAAHAGLADALARRAQPLSTVLTPHPLEAARLLGTEVARVQADRRGTALALAGRFQAIALLKGAGTVVATPEGDWSIVDSGSAALASAGTGDVLTGMIAALLARGATAGRAACLAAWLHGRAAQDWESAIGHAEGLNAAHLPELARAALGALLREAMR